MKSAILIPQAAEINRRGNAFPWTFKKSRQVRMRFRGTLGLRMMVADSIYADEGFTRSEIRLFGQPLRGDP